MITIRFAKSDHGNSSPPEKGVRRLVGLRRAGLVACVVSLGLISLCHAQSDRCDPAKVIGSASCARCHINESAAWKQTPHHQTFDALSRDPQALEICRKLGIKSVKRSDLCLNCHFTTQLDGRKMKPIEGISCESCHGAAADWIAIHNQYLSSSATRETETPQQAAARLATATELGMNNTRNLYQIASNCLNCHTIPHEDLVNVGGHKATSAEFEFVSWSQGIVRHNFLRTGGHTNGASSPQRLRVMFVTGLLADLEFSLKATAKATAKSTYGVTVANRAAQVALKLYAIDQQIQDPHVRRALLAFAQAELRLNNQQQLLEIASQIRQAGEAFASQNDGTNLAAIDSMLPSPQNYR